MIQLNSEQLQLLNLLNDFTNSNENGYFGVYKANSIKEKPKFKFIVPTKGNRLSSDELDKIWDDLDKKRNDANNQGLEKKD